MKVLITLTDGKQYFLDRDINANEIAFRGDEPAEDLIIRYTMKCRIPGSLKDWEYKTDWEIRDLLEENKVTEIELYEDLPEDDWDHDRDSHFDEEPYVPEYDDRDYMY